MIIAAYRVDFSMIMRRHTRSMSAIYSGISDGCCPLRSLKLAPSAPQGAHVNNPMPMRSASAIYSGISDGCLSPPLAKARPLRPPGGTCEQSAANALCERNI